VDVPEPFLVGESFSSCIWSHDGRTAFFLISKKMNATPHPTVGFRFLCSGGSVSCVLVIPWQTVACVRGLPKHNSTSLSDRQTGSCSGVGALLSTTHMAGWPFYTRSAGPPVRSTLSRMSPIYAIAQSKTYTAAALRFPLIESMDGCYHCKFGPIRGFPVRNGRSLRRRGWLTPGHGLALFSLTL